MEGTDEDVAVVKRFEGVGENGGRRWRDRSWLERRVNVCGDGAGVSWLWWRV